MYPQAFLKTFWRLELRPQVFVAMSFDRRYQPRFEDVIAPAIRAVSVDGVQLEPHRVDTSQSGDCILTQIVDGIAHSQLVLADVSSIGKDSVTRDPYRNGNVMYEVGVAVACRAPSEVVLVRDDHDKFLFDTSTIPHMTIDFTNEDAARTALHEELAARLQQRDLFDDARVALAVATLSHEELVNLKDFANAIDDVWALPEAMGLPMRAAIRRLLDKQLLRFVGESKKGKAAYRLTPLGPVVAQGVKSGLRTYTFPAEEEAAGESGEGPEGHAV